MDRKCDEFRANSCKMFEYEAKAMIYLENTYEVNRKYMDVLVDKNTALEDLKKRIQEWKDAAKEENQ